MPRLSRLVVATPCAAVREAGRRALPLRMGKGLRMSVDPIDTGVCDWIWDGELAARYGYSQTDLANFARLLARPCPFCHAKPGERCTTREGTPILDLDWQHVARHAYPGR